MNNKRRLFQKTIAWTLIAAMINPAAIAPAFARDTDIFLTGPSGTNTAEPNIMIVLDTSDSMWIPEPWHEVASAELVNGANVDDPANYDSHYEYLWNDTNFIYSIGCNVGSCSSGGDQFTNAGKNLPRFADYDALMQTMPQGFFDGATTTARGTLKQAAINWAATTVTPASGDPADPGVRSTYRNYGGGTTSSVMGTALYDSNWAYWLPAGTAETDLRLMSTSPSRAPVGSRTTGFSGSNGPTTNPVIRGGVNYGNIADNSAGNFNSSTLAHQQGTGMNRCASSYPNLLPSTVYAPGPYAKNAGKWLDKQWARYERFLGLDNTKVADFPASAAGDAAQQRWVTAPYFTGTMVTSPNHLGTSPATTQMIGHDFEPIRLPGSGYAGWTDLRTDLGGFTDYRNWLYNAADSGANNTILINTLAAFGITTNALQARVRAAVRTFETGAHVSAKAGCTDAASCALVGVSLGIPAYHDVLGSHPDPATTATVCAWSPSDGRINAGPDAKTTSRLYRSGAAGTATNPTCIRVSGPGTCGITGGSPWSRDDNRNSAWTGRSTLVAEGTTYFHGGTCQGRCSYGVGDIAQCQVGANALPGPANVSSFASAPTYSTKTVTNAGPLVVGGTTIYDVRTDSITAGCADNGDLATVLCSTKSPGCVAGSQYSESCSVTSAGASTLSAYEGPITFPAQTDPTLNHDCLDDNGIANYNGVGSTANIRSQNRTFATAYNTSNSSGTVTHTYSISAADAITPTAAKNVDMYSVNYLNWKYGPRGPNGRPIARKTRLQIAKDALANLVQITNGVRFGLMVFNGLPNDLTKRNSEGSQGARVAYPITRMGGSVSDTPDFNNRAALIQRIFAQEAKAATPLTESVYEAMLYFTGRAPRFGTDTAITANFPGSLAALGGGNVTTGADATAVCTATGAQCTAVGNYKSPIMNNPNTTTPAACQKNFVILITDGGPDRDSDANAQIRNTYYTDAVLGVVSAKTTVDATNADTTAANPQFEVSSSVPYGPVSLGDSSFDGGYIWLDELTYFMSKADMSPGASIFVGDTGGDTLLAGRQSIITYTVGFAGGNSPVLANAATGAGGNYYTADNSAQLATVLTDALVSIVNWNPTIAAPTVPISAVNRLQSSTDIFLAFFQPDPSQAWKGTLKKYQLGRTLAECGDNTTLCLMGQTVLNNPLTCGSQGGGNCRNVEQITVTDPGPPPITSTGVHTQAISYWNPLTVIDGGQPAQGGTGYQLLNTAGYNPSTRLTYTFLTNGASTSTALTNAGNRVRDTNALINNATVIPATTTDTQRSTLINFVLGGDTSVAACSDASGTATACTAWRSWAHADIQHSKPAIVTYDSTTTPNPVQYIYYTSNDGLLHAVDTNTGQEKWTFLIEEAYSKLSAMLNDNIGPSLDIADGSLAVWFNDANGDGIINGSDQVYLFFGLRRGGNSYYAIDVSSRDAPVFKWKISGGGGVVGTGRLCVGTAACVATAGYDQLGQTWSTPTVGKVRSPGGTGSVALIFGGGYDPAEDSIPPGARTMGRAVYVVAAETGNIINSWGVGQAGTYRASSGTMAYAVPSDVTALNTDADAQGFLDRVYVGDVGGNLWRMDLNNPSAAAWNAKQLATLSDATGESRKFLFPPTVVKQNDPARFDAVYIGSGDREHPRTTSTTTPVNANRERFFMLKDDAALEATAGLPITLADLLQRGNGDTSQVTTAAIADPIKGWSITLDDGEKTIGAPTVFFNKLRFGTYAPLGQASLSQCAPFGVSRLNEIDALTGNFFDLNAGGGITAGDRYYGGTFLPPGFVSTGQIVVLGNSIYHIVASGGQLHSKRIGDLGTATKIYWYMEPEQ